MGQYVLYYIKQSTCIVSTCGTGFVIFAKLEAKVEGFDMVHRSKTVVMPTFVGWR